eukprot:m.1065849 g.1065849  ORF g.1065849 m.1065849 type:complete len:391 (-) comp24220_c0_seq28:1652-2824(-)
MSPVWSPMGRVYLRCIYTDKTPFRTLLCSYPITALAMLRAAAAYAIHEHSALCLPARCFVVLLMGVPLIPPGEAYGPRLRGCHCNGTNAFADDYPSSTPLVYSEHCGYGRCLPTSTGCSTTGAMHNTSSCALQPFSVCLASCDDGQYWDEALATCLPISDCRTVFALRAGAVSASQAAAPQSDGVNLQGYEYAASTTTTNRLCTICSTCASGYTTTPCTATTNTQCSKSDKLSLGDVFSIIMAVVILGTAAAAGFWYGRKHRRSGTRAQYKLEQTELLLSDVTEEKERLQQAWVIPEEDVILNRQLASGAFGTVWSGRYVIRRPPPVFWTKCSWCAFIDAGKGQRMVPRQRKRFRCAVRVVSSQVGTYPSGSQTAAHSNGRFGSICVGGF